MANPATELLFPPRLIPALMDARGEPWRIYVYEIQGKPTGDIDRLAMIYFMARLASCSSCQSDSLRAIQGCEHCARQSLRRFRGSDEELVLSVQTAKQELMQLTAKQNREKKDVQIEKG